jgi:hypothetical protein
MKSCLVRSIARPLLTLTTLLVLASSAAAEDAVIAGFSPEPGDAAFAYVPATVAPEEVLVVLIDEVRTDGLGRRAAHRRSVRRLLRRREPARSRSPKALRSPR